MPLQKNTSTDGKEYVQYITWDKNEAFTRLRPFYYTKGMSDLERAIVDKICIEDALKYMGVGPRKGE